MTDSPEVARAEFELAPRPLATTAAWSWRLIVIAVLIALVASIFYQLRVITVPIFLAVLLSTLVLPPVRFLENRGLKPALATLVVFLGIALAFVGGVYLLASAGQDQFSKLGPQIDTAVERLNNWLVTGPFKLEQAQLDRYVDNLETQLRDNAGSLRTGVVHSATLAAEIFAGFILTIVLTVLFVSDGQRLVNGMIVRFPPRRRALVRASVDRAYHALGGYLRGVAMTGLVDAFFIGIALAILGVPLLIPLVVLTFFGAFFPVVGATLAGALAAAVALVNGGPTDALIVILVVLGVQQLEGHILQPLLVGRGVALHPVVIIIALGAGAVVAGILGAFVAVPLAAVIGAIWREIDEQDEPEEQGPPEEDKPIVDLDPTN